MTNQLLVYDRFSMSKINQVNSSEVYEFGKLIRVKEYCTKFLDILKGENKTKRKLVEMDKTKPESIWIKSEENAISIHRDMMKKYEKFQNKGIYKYTIMNREYSEDVQQLMDMLGEEE